MLRALSKTSYVFDKLHFTEYHTALGISDESGLMGKLVSPLVNALIKEGWVKLRPLHFF